MAHSKAGCRAQALQRGRDCLLKLCTPALLCSFHLGSTKLGRWMEPGYQCTSHICSMGLPPLLCPQGFTSPNHRVLDLAPWDTQELSKPWLLRSPDMESSRGHREGREEKGKKGLIVQERRVGNFTGRPEQSLEETQALSMAPPTPWVIYGMETMLEKQTLLSPACFAPSADTASLSHSTVTGLPRTPCWLQDGRLLFTKGEQEPAPHSSPSHPIPAALSLLLLLI